jgi:stage IV sporulation protein A
MGKRIKKNAYLPAVWHTLVSAQQGGIFMDSFQVYRDIKARTDGEIYLGVVGPVRTGKSTFIKRFADLLILPNLTDVHKKERTKDELPQSASGTTIMTTEPKFVPKEAVSVKLGEDVEVKIRLVDCVGYMVEGASGHIENGTERQVKTPWFEYEIPFTKAAAIGTQKVIHDHATIGLVVTTDGSVTELARENYIPAEEKTVRELQEIGKPFLIILNCQKPYAEEAKSLKEELQEKYQAPVIAMNCEQMKAEDLHEMMQQILYEFPVTEVEFYLPKWVEMLSRDHRIKQNLLENVKTVLDALGDIRSAVNLKIQPQGEYIDRMQVEKVEMDSGKVCVRIGFDQKYGLAFSESMIKTAKKRYGIRSGTPVGNPDLNDERTCSDERGIFADPGCIYRSKNERIRGCMSEKRGDYAG